jgi:hypothetical protein
LVLDFYYLWCEFHFPIISATFYAGNLEKEDWGEISGTEGRNTKVTGMKSSGKKKMGEGWIAIAKDEKYIKRYSVLLNFSTNPKLS